MVDWRCGLTPGIHCLLRLVRGKWPPTCPAPPWLEGLREQLQRELALPTTRAVHLRRCREFLSHLAKQGIGTEDVRGTHVSSFTLPRALTSASSATGSATSAWTRPNIYAQANLETKRQALEKADGLLRPRPTPSWRGDADLLAWLDSL